MNARHGAMVAILLAVQTVTAADAHAQSAPASATAVPLSQSLSGRAKTDYDSAKSLFEIGDFGGAFLKFESAFEQSSDPRLLWNMAACRKERHHYGQAVALVERYLKEGGTRITAEARENATQTLAALRALTTEVTLREAPDGAKVLLDDEVVGTTPLAAPLMVDLGSHQLRVEHPDHQPFEKRLESVTGGGTMTVDVTLAPLVDGRLVVIAGPGDTISLDGAVVGSERWEGSVKPGSHSLHVTAAGKTPYDSSVTLAPRATRTVQVSLRSTAKTGVWPWVVGGAVVAAGAVVGGYFLFKPGNEPGPYATGGLGTVVLP